MKNNIYLQELCERLCINVRPKVMERLSLRIVEHGAVLVLERDAKKRIIPDTPENRAKYCGHAWIVDLNGATFLKVAFMTSKMNKHYNKTRMEQRGASKMEKRAYHGTTDKLVERPKRMESCGKMFKIGQENTASKKKPASGGSFKTWQNVTNADWKFKEENRVSNWGIIISND